MRSASARVLRVLLWLGWLATPPAQGQVLSFVQVIKDDTVVDGLDGAQSTAMSPDGRHVYVASFEDDAVVVFSRDPATGSLMFVEMQQNGIGNVAGLDGAVSVTVSPDGRHVYVAGFFDDALTVFSRDPVTGALTFVQVQKDGIAGVDGLDAAVSVAVSPDGAHVYVAGRGDDAVAVFQREATTGGLTFTEIHQDGVAGVDGLFAARSVTVSPDGANLYATGFEDDAVAVFRRNTATGSLTFVEAHKDGKAGVNGLDGANAVIVSPDGAHVYVTGFDDDAVTVFSRDAATGALAFVEVHVDQNAATGVGDAEGLDAATSVTMSPDGAHLYVTGGGDDAVAVFRREAATGALTFVEVLVDRDAATGIGDAEGLDAAASVTVSPDGAHLYVAGANDDAVAVFGRNAATGALTFVQVEQDGVGDVEGLEGAVSMAASPDGRHVYVAGFHDDAVAVFSRTASTGVLTFVEAQRDGIAGVDGLDGAGSVAMSGDGAHLYVAGELDNAVAVFSRNASTGALTFVEMQQDGIAGVDGLGLAFSVTVSPDDAHVYVRGALDDAVAVFSREASTGALTFVQVQKDGIAGVDGLDGSGEVVVSPDGAHLYATGGADDAVAVFSRNATTGALTFVEVQKDGVAGVDGLDAPIPVTVSPDGAHVYVASFEDNAVAIFSRNVATGMLTFVEVEQDGGAGALAVSPNGAYLYVTGGAEDAVTVFSRNATTGALTFVEVQQDGLAGVDGLDGASSVAVSPDGHHLYVAGFLDNAVAVFRVNDAPGPTPVEQQHPLPTRFALHPSYPNPFQDAVTIAYDVEAPTRVVLRVYNALGQAVATLVDRPHGPGRYTAQFEAGGLPSGVYVYRIEMGVFRAARLMLLVK